MTDFLQVEENNDLVREKSSTAIINKNRNAYKKAIERRQKKIQEKERIDNLEKKVDLILEKLEKLVD